MSNKIIYEDVINYITKNSKCRLLTKQEEYKDTTTKLKLECEHGHIFEKIFVKIKQGQWCSYCSGKHKYTFDEVKTIIQSENGYKLLSTEYKNCKQKLDIECDKGHIFPMSFDSFNNHNARCPICNTGGKYKYSLEMVKKIFKNSGCELLEDTYINCDTPMSYKCICGNNSKITLTSFNLGCRCENCKNIKIGNALRMNFEDVKNIFKNEGCELLSTAKEYINSSSQLKYKCSCGNNSIIDLNHFQRGERCLECLSLRRKNTNIERFGVESPSQNIKIQEKTRITLYQNNTCPISKQQIYLHSLIGGSLNYPVKTSSLDIAFPEDNIYLEYDGSGHGLQVYFGNLTQHQFNNKEKRRSYALYREGWKEIRIISRNDKLPSKEVLLQMYKYAKEYLNTGHSWIHFDIDNSRVKCSQYDIEYNYGIVKRIRAS